jgi:hypothetical protein
MTRLGLAIVTLCGLAAATAAAQERRILELRGLDKVTARISRLELEIGKPARFGTLEITAQSCSKRPPEEPPEVTAFLEINEVRPGREAQKLFSGWMFASSPALNALEHPVYDVWVIDCRTVAPGR